MDLFAYLVAKRAAGGTGGTDDYRDLTNKPKINSYTLEGNQTAADLGLSTFSGSYTDLTDKPTLGTAAEKGVDSSPTASSTNLVESGGVASVLADKQDALTAAQQAAADSGITAAKVSTYDSYGTWEEYECFYATGAGSYFDSNTSSVKVRVNRALKRCVADISLSAIANIDTSTSAFNFASLSGILNNAEIRPRATSRTLVVSKADNSTAVVSKASSNATLSFFVSAGIIANGTSLSCQLCWDFV